MTLVTHRAGALALIRGHLASTCPLSLLHNPLTKKYLNKPQHSSQHSTGEILGGSYVEERKYQSQPLKHKAPLAAEWSRPLLPDVRVPGSIPGWD